MSATSPPGKSINRWTTPAPLRSADGVDFAMRNDCDLREGVDFAMRNDCELREGVDFAMQPAAAWRSAEDANPFPTAGLFLLHRGG
jgi:hypothetical protein